MTGKEKALAIIAEDVERLVSRMPKLLRKLEGKRLMLTGASGLVPSYFLDTIAYLNRHVFKKKTRVLAYIHKPLPTAHRLAYLKNEPWLVWRVSDLNKPFKIEGAYDFIIHAASTASPKDYIKKPLETLDVNVAATRIILEHLRKRPGAKLLFFSSGEIYGIPEPAKKAFKESDIGRVNHLALRACYSEGKRFGETLCLIYARRYNVHVKIARLFHTFGPGIKKEDSRVWSALIFRALEGRDLKLMDARTRRCFCYVTDAIAELWHVLLAAPSGEVYNIGTDRESSIGEFARLVKKYSGRPVIIKDTGVRTGAWEKSASRVRPDITKIVTASGLKPLRNLKESIDRTMRWCRYFYLEK
ncbi:MAG: NAD-dependent epimerase/dehydratase family protein [bacterium]|nr:NAD-dependent epimerase/dehydratase family protein [bacterium]